jgi:hypothetical protein
MVRVHKKQQDYKIESSDAYRAFTKPLNKDTTEKEMDAKKALLILETQEKDAEQQCLPVTRPEVVLPTWLVHLV